MNVYDPAGDAPWHMEHERHDPALARCDLERLRKRLGRALDVHSRNVVPRRNLDANVRIAMPALVREGRLAMARPDSEMPGKNAPRRNDTHLNHGRLVPDVPLLRSRRRPLRARAICARPRG